jgi:hypothetical protein
MEQLQIEYTSGKWRLFIDSPEVSLKAVLRLIHTCYAAPLPFSNRAVSFMKVHVVARNILTASPTV